MTLVFVGHEATLTGAPYTQLHILRWLKEHTNYQVELILLRGGPLEQAFREVAQVYILNDQPLHLSLSQRVLAKLSRIIQYRKRRIIQKLNNKSPRIIFANTILSIKFAIELKNVFNIPLIANLHELESMFFFNSLSGFAADAASIDFFVPCSKFVKDFYYSFCSFSESNTEIVYDFTSDNLIGSSSAASIRNKFNIPAEAKIVGAVGSFGWRKGPDLFLQIASEVLKDSKRNAYFIWLGGDRNSSAYKEVVRDVRLMGLNKQVLFVGAHEDVRGFYEAFDVFLLTSREDPFPLVCMEAALAKTPIICFDQAGGMPEFVRQDAGFVVHYADVQAMSNKTVYLLDNDEERDVMGQVAYERATNHHTIKVIGPQIEKIIKRFLK